MWKQRKNTLRENPSSNERREELGIMCTHRYHIYLMREMWDLKWKRESWVDDRPFSGRKSEEGVDLFHVLIVVPIYEVQCLVSFSCSETKDSAFFTHCFSLSSEDPLRSYSSMLAWDSNSLHLAYLSPLHMLFHKNNKKSSCPQQIEIEEVCFWKIPKWKLVLVALMIFYFQKQKII